MAAGRNKPLGVSLELDPSDFARGLREVDRRVTSTAREMEGALGRALRDTTQDLRKLGDKAPGVAASMLRLEDAQNQYNRALAKHGEESRQAKLALARVADQQDKVRIASDKAARSVDHATDEIARQGRVARTTSKGLGLMKTGLIGLGVAAGYGAVRGITASIKAASDLNEEVSKTKTVFGDSSKQVIAFSETTARSLGISQRAALASAGQLGNMLVPMGIATDKASEMSIALVKLSGDMASFNNASPEDTLLAIQSGLAGETEPLRKYGVFLDAARIKAEAMSSGLVKSQKDMVLVREAQVKLDEATLKLNKARAEHGAGSIEVRKAQIAETKATRKLKEELKGHNVELTAAQKAQATWNIIMKDTKVQQGDAARTGNELAGMQRSLGSLTQDLSARFGQKLLPAVKRVAATMLANWPRIERAVDSLGDATAGFVDFMGNVVTGRWKKAWQQILNAVEMSKGPLGTAATEVGKAIASGMIQGFQDQLRNAPSSLLSLLPGALQAPGLGTLIPGGRQVGAAIERIRGGGSGGGSGSGGGGFATGGVIPGRYDARDDVTVRVSRGEVILNPLQTSMLGRDQVMRVLYATGGRMGGDAFATGGVVDAYNRATSKLGTPYSYGKWDCSDYAYYVAGMSPWGTTASAASRDSVPASGDEPVLWGLRKSHAGGWQGGKLEHMGVGVLGPDGKRRWFDNGSGGVQSNADSTSWQLYRVPKNWAGVDTGTATSGASSSPPPGISVKQFKSAVDEARQTGGAGQVSRPSLTDIPSVDRRHADDALQERVIRRRGGKDSDVYAFQKKELERDIKDVTKQIRKLVQQRNRLVKLQRTLRRQGASTKTSRVTREAVLERFRNVSQTLTETRDAIITLQEMRRGMILDAKVLGFDVQDAQAEEAQEAADQAAEESTDPGLTDAQQSALVNLGAWAQSGEAFARAAGGAGDIGVGGRSALAAAFNPGGQAININVQAMHPGDPSVYRAISETVIRALGTQGNVPATTLATGA